MPRLKITLAFLFVTLVTIRLLTFDWTSPTQTKQLTWDAFGYYLYLPGIFIYDDIKQLDWLPNILETYHPTPHLYQVISLPTGNYAMKYLGGLAFMYAPFFGLGHLAAGLLGFPQDGFSPPYQWAICLASLIYAFVGLWILGKVLLRFFSENITAITLLLVALASNYPEYTAIQAGLTHGYLFTIYALQLLLTIRWHDQPTLARAFSIGWLVGLAGMTRPTDGVMLFVPLLWQATGFDKWQFVRKNPSHIFWAAAGVFVGVLPQLIYWKFVTEQWVFDVGSKWYFLNPWWRVLFGWEKGWFIYTPIAIFMVAGLFLMKNRPFRAAVITFFLLNTWIIISWADWRYGASYSTRALLQGCSILALPLACLVERITGSRWKIPAILFAIFLIFLNLFQIGQYQRNILHYDHMNFDYYRAIFLDPNPTPLDMSLLDTREILRDEKGFSKSDLFHSGDSIFLINSKDQPEIIFGESAIQDLPKGSERWLHISAEVKSAWGAFDAHLFTEYLPENGLPKSTACRLENGICKKEQWNRIEYYFKIPDGNISGKLRLGAKAKGEQHIFLRSVRVEFLGKNNSD